MTTKRIGDSTMKIEEQVLSREQMAHLVELGIDTSDASMCWMVDLEDGEEEVVVFNPIMLGYATCKLYPTYTIGDLIEKLPKIVNGDSLLIEFYASDLGYGNWESYELYEINAQQNFKDKPLKDALYNLLCWVAENHKELIK